VDSQEGIVDPVGMTGVRLEVDTHSGNGRGYGTAKSTANAWKSWVWRLAVWCWRFGLSTIMSF